MIENLRLSTCETSVRGGVVTIPERSSLELARTSCGRRQLDVELEEFQSFFVLSVSTATTAGGVLGLLPSLARST